MQKAEILRSCPCGSGINFENCCQPHLLGLEKPLTAEALMRARYSAFVAGEVQYIIDTNHPDTKNDLDEEAIAAWSENSEWLGLEVVLTEKGSAQDTEGVVEFVAKYSLHGENQFHHERALFKKKDDDWYFYDVKKREPIRNENKIGRNDPCLCGSGKKFKKCCEKKAS